MAGRKYVIHFLVLAGLTGSLTVDCSHAQITQQTVQLPTFHYFGVQTTVVVPDRGSMSLGGVGSYVGTRTQFDKVGPSSSGFNRNWSGLSMRATIHDLEAMDRAILAEAARRRGAKFDVLGRPVLGQPAALHTK